MRLVATLLASIAFESFKPPAPTLSPQQTLHELPPFLP